MANARITHVISHLRRLALLRECEKLADGQLLERFLARRDEEAFAALVRRHGPMVLAVCRRVLRSDHDAEDAFQATFLVLARKASSVKPRDMVGNWLHGVARRTALKARTATARRHRVERQAGSQNVGQGQAEDGVCDLRSFLDDELHRLPGKYGAPLVLCFLEGKTRKEAAYQLGWSEGTLSGRLARAKEMLAMRLARRGSPISAGALSLLLEGDASASVPGPLAAATARAALFVSSGRLPAGATSTSILALTEEVLSSMFQTKLKLVTAVLLAVGTVVGAGVMTIQPQAMAGGEPRPSAAVTTQAGQSPAPAAKRALPLYVIGPPDVLLVEAPVKLSIPRQILVRPDGTAGLGSYGAVAVAGLTIEETRQAIARRIRKDVPDFDSKSLNVDVMAYNSQAYYVIVEDARAGDEVLRLPLTGSDTVLDGLSQLKGLKSVTVDQEISLVRDGKRLPVDWEGLTRKGETKTNYLLKAGDRILVRRPNQIALNARNFDISRESGKESQQAGKDLRIAAFYERTGHSHSARFYYELVKRRYPDSPESAKAEERLRQFRDSMLNPSEGRLESRLKLGRITIVGNSRTPEEVILWAFPLNPGDEFTNADLKRSEDTLNRLGRSMADARKRFGATVTAADPNPADSVCDVLITIRE
jgi:RNA polymerase sigma factor (sigma-70 family)